MAILGLILLVLGLIFAMHALVLVGAVLLVIGIVIGGINASGRDVGGRRWWY